MSALDKYVLSTHIGEINVYIKDNKAASTIVFIHGFNSSHAFAESVYSKENNFNIVTFDFPRFGVHFEKLLAITSEVNSKLLRGKHFYFLGHSLGGAIVVSLKDQDKVKGRILVSPLNPSLAKATSYARFEAIIKPIGVIQKVSSKIIKVGASIMAKLRDNKLVQEFLAEDSEYKDVVDNTILNRDFLERELLDNYHKTKKNTYYAIGDNDQIIPSELFIEFVKNELNKDILVIPDSHHNPFKDNPTAMHTFLNNVIPFKRRWFFTNFYTLNNTKDKKRHWWNKRKKV